jgi:hypothetical protein
VYRIRRRTLNHSIDACVYADMNIMILYHPYPVFLLSGPACSDTLRQGILEKHPEKKAKLSGQFQ